MIYDSLKNADIYYGMNSDLDKAFDIAKTLSASSDTGKTVVNDNLYYMIMEVDTVPEEDKNFETHVHYADFQLILQGDEKVNVIEPSKLTKSCEYNAEADCQLYDYKKSDGVCVGEGEFYVVFPHEGHMPTCKNISNSVKKVVFKVRTN